LEKLQLLNSAGAFYPSILLAVLPIVFMLGGLWFIFKFFKKVETQSEWIKESEIFADKKFADYLNEKNLEGGSIFICCAYIPEAAVLNALSISSAPFLFSILFQESNP